MSENTKMLTALVQLRSALQEAQLRLDVPDIEQHRTARTEMIDQLEDYIIPRMMTLDAPLLAVVGGSTGAGKSTLVNSLVGTRVTQPGVLRPTTRSPVLVHNPADAGWFGQDRILPDLARTEHATADPDALQLVAAHAVPQGLAVLDAPDVDSVEATNRTLAAQLLAAADLWLFVTSSARYADQVPWEFLSSAAERSTSVAIVLDRTPDEAINTVSAHLARMLASRGLKDCPLFVVTEGTVDDHGLLPAGHVANIRGWLESLASDAHARSAVVKQTLGGAIRSLSQRSYAVATATDAQGEAAARLREDVDRVYDACLESVTVASVDGTVLRGEVLARWQEFVGTGELLRSLESTVNRMRDRLVNAVRGKPQQAEQVSAAVESGLTTLLVEHDTSATESVVAAWGATAPGASLLASGDHDMSRPSPKTRSRAEDMVQDWQQGVLDMVRTEAEHKRATARVLAYGVQGLAVALEVVVLTSGAGSDRAGGDISTTDSTADSTADGAGPGRDLLEAVLGDQAVRTLTARARKDLHARVGDLVEAQRHRYAALLDDLAVDPGAPDAVRAAIRRVDDERFARREDGLGGHSA